jgi:hypothetical protein
MNLTRGLALAVALSASSRSQKPGGPGARLLYRLADQLLDHSALCNGVLRRGGGAALRGLNRAAAQEGCLCRGIKFGRVDCDAPRSWLKATRQDGFDFHRAFAPPVSAVTFAPGVVAAVAFDVVICALAAINSAFVLHALFDAYDANARSLP